MSILNLIASNNFIVVNKTIIKALGLDEAVILGELASEYMYWKNQGRLIDGYFFSTIENIEENTTLTAHKQREALKHLQEIEIVDVQRKGLPAKRYIRIDEKRLMEILDIIDNLDGKTRITPQLLKNLTTGDKKIHI